MFIQHGKLLRCLKLLQPNSSFGEQQAFSLLFPDGDEHNHWPVVLRWLKTLPDHEKAEKICAGFDSTAQKAGARFSAFAWWDIIPQTRHLFGNLQRADDVTLRMLFIWKKRPDENREAALAVPGSASWACDRTVPGNWRFEIEGETYDHVMAAFVSMLSKELPPLPSGKQLTTRVSSFPRPVISLADVAVGT